MLNHDSESSHSSGPPRIIFQGRLVLPRACPAVGSSEHSRSENRAFELLVIGDGPERIAIEELAKKQQLSSVYALWDVLPPPTSIPRLRGQALSLCRRSVAKSLAWPC